MEWGLRIVARWGGLGGFAGLCLLVALGLHGTGRAVEVAGTGWKVLYNLPDNQPGTGFGDDEFRLHRHLAGRIGDLGAGDTAVLGTFTWSANEAGAGRILYEMDQALGRGATISFVGSTSVSTSTAYGNNQDFASRSLDSLLAAHPLRFRYVGSPAAGGVHHNKIGLFDYSGSGAHGGGKFVFTSSMNFTGASSTQWNVAVEIEGAELHGIYLREAEELLAGRFGNDPAKSHAHDGSVFTLEGRTGQRVRFSPPPASTAGGNNPETEIIARIEGARHRIVFALNKLTLSGVTDALIAAANRGVEVVGAMPRSDTDSGGDSRPQWLRLADPAAYPGGNPVVLLTARQAAGLEERDDGSVANLIHAKSMVVDDRHVLHGSPNWTFTALRSASGNDENLLVMDHPGVARAFLEQFEAMTGHELFSEKDLLAWDVGGLTGYGPSPFAPRVVHAGLAATGWERGAGVATSGTAAANAWGGSGWSPSAEVEVAAEAGSVAGFSLTVPSDQSLRLTEISAHDFRRSSTGPAWVRWQFAVGGGGFVDLGEPRALPSTSSAGNPQAALDLRGIPALSGLAPGVTVRFRLVVYGAGGTSGTWYLRDANPAGDDFVLRGIFGPPGEARPQGFASWAALHLGGQEAGGDFDGDGLLNLLEYALRTRSDGPDGGLAELEAGGGRVRFWKRPEAAEADDVRYVLLVSSDLSEWLPLAADQEDGNSLSVAWPPAGMTERAFLRLRVEEVAQP